MTRLKKFVRLPILILLLLPGLIFGYEVTSNSVTFGWTAPGDDGNSGTATAYDIRYSNSAISDANWDIAIPVTGEPYPRIAGSAETFTVNGLEPASMYYFAIKSVDEVGNYSPLSNIFSATTSIILEENDDSLTILAPLPGSILNTAQPTLVVENIDDQVSNSYLFEITQDLSFSEIVITSGSISQQTGNSTSWQIPEPLDNGVTFYWRVTANNTIVSDTNSFTIRLATFAYPNPFYTASSAEVIFTNIPAGKDLILMTVSGREVRVWKNTIGNDIIWNGTNDSGTPVASDTYLWFITDTNIKGKIVVIR